ncbi:hypothetical protein QBA79_39590 [Streptomyces scabiei]
MHRRGGAADPQMDHVPADRDNPLGLGQNLRCRAGGVDDYIKTAAAGGVTQFVGQFAASLSAQDPVGSTLPAMAARSAAGSIATTRFAPAPRARATAARPSGPQPKTATSAPGAR